MTSLHYHSQHQLERVQTCDLRHVTSPIFAFLCLGFCCAGMGYTYPTAFETALGEKLDDEGLETPLCIHPILHPSDLHHIQRLLVEGAVAVRGWSQSGVDYYRTHVMGLHSPMNHHVPP